MRFYKSPSRQDPTHSLPTVQYKNGESYFEFTRGASGYLEYETENPEKISFLTEMGYRPEDTASPEAPHDNPPVRGRARK